jgi:predicted neuraminidase
MTSPEKWIARGVVTSLIGANMLTFALNASGQESRPSGGDFILVREFVYADAPFPSAHASTIVEARPGILIAAWFGGTQEGSNDVEIWSSRKEQDKPWSLPVRLTNIPDMAVWNPVLFQDGNRTWLFFKIGPSPREWVGAYRTSEDAGESWSDITYLPAGLLGPIRAKPIHLADGSWLAGSSVEAGYRWDTPADAPYRTWTCWAERSSDKGKSWTRFGPIAIPGQPYGVIQPALWQTATGEVRMFMRSTERVGRVVFSASKDGGRTWSPAKLTALPNPNAGIDLVKLRDGRLVLIYNHTPQGRDSIHLAVSRDDGDSWSAPYVLEEGQGEFSYPAVIQSDDGLIHVTYTWRRKLIRHLVLDPENLPG